MGGYALLVAADEVHSHKPLDEAYLGVLEYRTHGHVERALALRAAVSPVLAGVAVVPSAVRAHDVAVLPP